MERGVEITCSPFGPYPDLRLQILAAASVEALFLYHKSTASEPKPQIRYFLGLAPRAFEFRLGGGNGAAFTQKFTSFMMKDLYICK